MIIKTFWILAAIIFYSYFGYFILLWIINIFSRKKKEEKVEVTLPEVTIFISAYNESDIIKEKLLNTNQLDYPEGKLKQLWITDGSNDSSVDILRNQSGIQHYHQDKRAGKTGAINRGIQFVETPIVVFTDANTMLNRDSIKELVKFFQDPRVGCVAGEKRIKSKQKDNAASTGEGLYWKMESKLKEIESEVNSTLGAAGELFAIRRELFEELPANTILDDFEMSLKIALKGYKIKYAPKSYCYENASISIKEELKRKTRIAAGSFQTLFRLPALLNPIKNTFLSFQYFSHKVLRWLFVPYALIGIFLLNGFIAYFTNSHPFYNIFFYLQISFYFLVIIGGILQSKKTKFKILFAPFYAFIMNYALLKGFFRYIKGNYSVNWEKAIRE